MEKMGVAIIGCGYWGLNYVRVGHELPSTTVRVACDKQSDRLYEVGRRFPNVRLATELDDALACDGVDVAIICTTAATHHAVARQCLLAGKHVLVEKPMTTTSAEAEDLIELAERNDLVLMAGHTFLYNSGIQKLKSYMTHAALGRVYYLYARRTNMGPIRHDVNALWDLAPHDVAIFNYLLDSTPQWVSAVGAKVLHNSHEDVGFISLGYHDGIVGHIHVSWADPNKVREVVVVGSNKRIVFDDLSPQERVRVYEKSVVPVVQEASGYSDSFQLRDGDIISPRIEASEPLKNQVSHFIECVVHGTRPVSSGWDGLQVVRVMEAVDRSVERQGAPVEVAQEMAVLHA